MPISTTRRGRNRRTRPARLTCLGGQLDEPHPSRDVKGTRLLRCCQPVGDAIESVEPSPRGSRRRRWRLTAARRLVRRGFGGGGGWAGRVSSNGTGTARAIRRLARKTLRFAWSTASCRARSFDVG